MNPRKEVDRGRFPFTLPVFEEFDHLDFHPRVTFFIGENGSGKSTLLEAVATNFGFSAEGGSKNHTFATFDSHSDMADDLILAKGTAPGDTFFFRSETFYNVASYLANAQGYRYGDIHKRSHAQGFLEAVAQFKGDGLYLFDEPESALSIQGQLTFMAHMKRLVNEGSQLIIATHSPIILGFGDSWIYQFRESEIERVNYFDTEQVQLTKDFLLHRDRYAKLLDLGQVE